MLIFRYSYSFFLIVILATCKTEEKQDIASISGFIDQPLVDSLWIHYDLESERVGVNQDGAFYVELDIDTTKFVNIDFGYDQLIVYIKPNENLVMNVVGMMPSLHTSFEGGLARENNFLSKDKITRRIQKRFRETISPDQVMIEASQWASDMQTLPIHRSDLKDDFKSEYNQLISLLEMLLVKENHIKALLYDAENKESFLSYSLEEVIPLCTEFPYESLCLRAFYLYFKTEFVSENDLTQKTFKEIDFIQSSYRDMQLITKSFRVKLVHYMLHNVLFGQSEIKATEWTRLIASLDTYLPKGSSILRKIEYLYTLRTAKEPIKSISVLGTDLERYRIPIDSGHVFISLCTDPNLDCDVARSKTKNKPLVISMVPPNVNVVSWYFKFKETQPTKQTYYITDVEELQKYLHFEDVWKYDVYLKEGLVYKRRLKSKD